MELERANNLGLTCPSSQRDHRWGTDSRTRTHRGGQPHACPLGGLHARRLVSRKRSAAGQKFFSLLQILKPSGLAKVIWRMQGVLTYTPVQWHDWRFGFLTTLSPTLQIPWVESLADRQRTFLWPLAVEGMIRITGRKSMGHQVLFVSRLHTVGHVLA